MSFSMQPAIVERLLAVNREFYRTVADHFDATRQGWTPGHLTIVPYFEAGTKQEPISVLDVGCGNGRLARLLADQKIACRYTGVDNDAHLLQLAAEAVSPLPGIDGRFVRADLATDDWATPLQGEQFDVLLCLATVQHLPGYAMRLRLFEDFHKLSRRWAILSFWQFLTSPRFVAKQIAWTEIGLTADEVEPGDALLPWQQGVRAVRYVHQIDADEVTRLAANTGWRVHDLFRADGKEGDLNLYAVLEAEKN